MKAWKLLAICALGLPLLGCTTIPQTAQIDSSLLHSIRYARDESRSVGSRVWPNFESAPFGLLVTLEDREVLFCHGSIVNGFNEVPDDPVTECDLQERDSVFPKNLLAAMPVVDGVSTIVMGTPQSTGLDEASWSRTIFHEHFHQYQSTFDDYYQRLNDLNLSGGDNTGMWMLNYPFPYGSDEFGNALKRASHKLHGVVAQLEASLHESVSSYLEARQELEDSVSPRDWKYMELQLWAEGVARWAEIEVSAISSDSRISESGEALRQRTVSSLLDLDPTRLGREVAYSYGAAEAMLLDRCNPNWRRDYSSVMSLGELLNAINPSSCH
ncbi:hypothetical protein [Luteimonas sp. A478]